MDFDARFGFFLDTLQPTMRLVESLVCGILKSFLTYVTAVSDVIQSAISWFTVAIILVEVHRLTLILYTTLMYLADASVTR